MPRGSSSPYVPMRYPLLALSSTKLTSMTTGCWALQSAPRAGKDGVTHFVCQRG